MSRKYHNQPVIVDGVYFPSKREANRWGQLRLLLRDGKVRNLRRQVRYDLKAEGGAKVARYDADFVYEEKTAAGWVPVVEDVKGFKGNQVYRIKKRWMLAQYGVEIRET
jgi:hypothetical protein